MVNSRDRGDDSERDLFVNDGLGDRASNVRQKRNVVLRTTGPWSSSVHALLKHFREVGIVSCPEVLGTGFAEDGRETLSFLPGESPHPDPWKGDALATIGNMLKVFHDAGRSFLPPRNAR